VVGFQQNIIEISFQLVSRDLQVENLLVTSLL